MCDTKLGDVLQNGICEAMALNMSYCPVAHGALDYRIVGSLGWLWKTVGATCCWAISDVICDMCIKPALTRGSAMQEKSETNSLAGIDCVDGGSLTALHSSPAPATPVQPCALPIEDTRCQLTAEQNALVSGCLSLIIAVAATLSGIATNTTVESLPIDSTSKVAAVGGCFHFSAYLCTLCAFGSTSSTVITPLMQLSAVWMLPFSILAAALGTGTLIRPVHLLSVILICAGGFLPAAKGSLSELTTRGFWQQQAVRYVMLGELLICFYNMLLHLATFDAPRAEVTDGNIGRTMQFFLVSRVANGLTCISLFSIVPSLRHHAMCMIEVGPRFLWTAIFGELLSLCGVCIVTFSYASFYEPSVVNAVEGGMQQLFNLIFAILSHRVFGCGRVVDQVSVKMVSFVLVTGGLILSAA